MTTTISARRVLTPDGWLADHALTMTDGRIAAIAPTVGSPRYETLVPGFVDIQVNGHVDVDVATMTDDDWPRLRELLVGQGVTAWCPTLMTSSRGHYDERLEFLQQLTGTIAAAPAGGPTIIGVHLEGPYLGDHHGAHRGVPDGPIDIEWLASLPDIVRIVTVGPERLGAIETITRLTEQGRVVALGHTAATYDETIAAIDAGARLFTHCFNAVAPLHHRRPGPIGAALARDDVAISLIVDTVHVHPAVVKMAFRSKPSDQTILVTDAAAWQSGRLDAEAIEHRDGAPRLADGTLAGSSLTMDQAVRNAIDQCDVPLVAAIAAASANPARALGLHDRGSIRVGARADLVALTHDLTVEATWIFGRDTANGGATVR